MTAESNALSKPPPQGPDPMIGRTISGRFRVISLIARGGMGRVYRAEQIPLGRICAIKVVNAGFNSSIDPEFHRRFFLEASISSKLTHPNTVTVFDYGKTDEDIYFMAMELLEGRTLHRALREDGLFSEDRSVHVARQICRSLREAHGHGVIHRDLKPANVFLVTHADEKDFVKVLDFGLVKSVDERPDEQLTQTGLFMGSPKYMAPEQIEGHKVDARTDVYSLGVMLFEMATGKVPFERATSVNTLMAHVHEAVPPMRSINPHGTFSEDFEALVRQCLSKHPSERLSSMEELLSALKHVGSQAGGSGPHESRASMRVSSLQAPLMRAPAVSVSGAFASNRLRAGNAAPEGLATTTAAMPSMSVTPGGVIQTSEAGPHESASLVERGLAPALGASDGASGAPQPGLGLLLGVGPLAGQSAAFPVSIPSSLTPSLGSLVDVSVATPRRTGVVALLLAAAVVIGSGLGYGAYVWTESKKIGQTTADQPNLDLKNAADRAVSSAASGAVATRNSSAATAFNTVSLLVASEPEGASVRDEHDAVLCAKTPCNVPFLQSSLQSGQLIKLELSGYEGESRTLHLGEGGLVNVHLRRRTKLGPLVLPATSRLTAAPPGSTVPVAPTPGPSAATSGTLVPGFKATPY